MLGEFSQTVLIGGRDYMVSDLRVRDTSDRVATVEFAIDRDVVGPVLFDAVDFGQAVEVTQSVDEAVLPPALQQQDQPRQLRIEGEVVDLVDNRTGGGVTRRQVTAHSLDAWATRVRLSGSWPPTRADQEKRSTTSIKTVLQALADALGARLDIDTEATEIKQISATHDSVADVLDELQSRTGDRWEIVGTADDMRLVWFDPRDRLSPDIRQDRSDIVDGTLTVRRSATDIVNVVRVPAYQYRTQEVLQTGTDRGTEDT